MSKPTQPIRSLSAVAARAIVLTSGAIVVLALLLMVGLIVVESAVNHVGDDSIVSESLRWRSDGQLAICRRSVSGDEDRSLDGEVLPPKKPSAAYFSFVDERLKARRPVTHPSLRVERMGRADLSSSAEWFFQRLGDRGVYVIVESNTGSRVGYVGLKGFQRELPPDAELFDLSLKRVSARTTIANWDMRVMHLDWSGSDLNLSVDCEVMLQDNDRRLYAIDIAGRSTVLLHEGEAVRAIGLMKLAGQKTTRVALRFEDRIEERSIDARVASPLSVRLPAEVRAWPTFDWIPGKAESSDGQIYVRSLQERTEIVWADSRGEVARRRVLKLGTRRVIETVDGRIVSLPPFVAWVMSSMQCPGFTVAMFGMFAEADSGIGRAFDYELALAAIHGTTSSEVRRNTYSAAWLPLLVTVGIGGFWCWIARRRLAAFGATQSEHRFWSVWIAVFGLPGYLALRVHRSWPALMACSQCGQRTPCSQPMCLRCGSEFRALRSSSLSPLVATSALSARLSELQALGWRGVLKLLHRVDEFLFEGAARTGSATVVLVAKELRTVAGVAVLALGAYLLLVGEQLNLPLLNIFAEHTEPLSPFVTPNGYVTYVWIGVVLALALGLWQTVSESWNGAWQFLLHRPVSRNKVMLSKLAIGLGALLVLSAWPIALMGFWADQPGNFSAPFEWWMTEPFWREWCLLPVLYLAAFASGLRTANWWGTRLMPIAAVLAAFVVREQLASRLWPWWQEVALAGGLMGALVIVILTVGRERDYA